MITHLDTGSDIGWAPPGHTSSSGIVWLQMLKKLKMVYCKKLGCGLGPIWKHFFFWARQAKSAKYRTYANPLDMSWVILSHTSSCEHVNISRTKKL